MNTAIFKYILTYLTLHHKTLSSTTEQTEGFKPDDIAEHMLYLEQHGYITGEAIKNYRERGNKVIYYAFDITPKGQDFLSTL